MGKTAQNRLKALCEIATLKAERSQAVFHLQDRARRQWEAERLRLASTQSTSESSQVEDVTAALRYGSWKRQKIAELQLKIAQERARVQPLKEAAQRDAARREVAQKLLDGKVKSERQREQ